MRKNSAYLADVTTPGLLIAEELLAINLPNKRTELVRGRLIVREPPGFRHGVVAMDPERRIARVYRANGTESLLDATGSLDGEDLLPGFVCRLGEILR